MAAPRRLPRHRPLAWAATGVLVAVSLLHLAAASLDPLRDTVTLMSAVLGLAGLATVARFLTAHCFESRLAMVIIGWVTVVGLVLTHTVGAPGLPVAAWTVRDAVLTGLAALLAASWRVTGGRRLVPDSQASGSAADR
ncbi:hypothetical protein AAIB33_15725 [Microbacterium sp. AZCO]|uniref:hypothetical protein n=1 Tax=Microbacterium sp. AZCO TaxID=3142976 RepID=UPI0031F362F0